MMAGVGDWDRGVSLAQRAIQLNSNHPGWYWFTLAHDAYRRRDYQEALSFACRINMPGFCNAHALCAASYAQLGEWDAAIRSKQTALALRPDYAEEALAVEEFERWFYPEHVAHLLDGFRKASPHIQGRNNTGVHHERLGSSFALN